MTEPTREVDAFPLTCEWCQHSPATHLVVIDYLPPGRKAGAAVRQEHKVCAECAHRHTVLPPSFVGWWLFELVPDHCEEEGR